MDGARSRALPAGRAGARPVACHLLRRGRRKGPRLEATGLVPLGHGSRGEDRHQGAPHEERKRIVEALKSREGISFTLEEKDLLLEPGVRVRALVPVNDRSRSTYIGDRSVEDRARLAKTARGTCGACADYVKNIREKLQSMGIQDTAVEEFWSAVSK